MRRVTAVLWHIEVSHYNEKARWALDFKSVPYELRTPLPGLHGASALVATRGKQRRLPVLELDGRRIGDSTAIVAALEAHRPDPPLYPGDPEDRARALELEDFFDEQLAPALRRYVWQHTLGHKDAMIETLIPRASQRRKQAFGRLLPLMRPAVRKDYGVNAEAAMRAREQVLAAMDRVERELQPSGYLVGDRFSVADLAGAALFTPVLAPRERPYAPATVTPGVQELRDELEAREGGSWVAEMYARHRTSSTAVPA